MVPGYVYNIHTDNNGEVAFLDVFELFAYDLDPNNPLPKGKDLVQITGLEDKSELGLNSRKNYVVYIERQSIQNTPTALGQTQPDVIERSGNIADTPYERDIFRCIERLGGDEKLYAGIEDAPRGFAKPRDWSTLHPFHKERGTDDKVPWDQRKPWEFKGQKKLEETKKYGKIGPAALGKVIDITLEDSAQIFGIKGELINAFKNPSHPNLEPLNTLRQVRDLMRTDPDQFETYLAPLKLDTNIKLSDLTEQNILESHMNLASLLAEPKKGTDAKPLVTLDDALKALAKGTEEIQKYAGMGKRNAEWAIEDIQAAHQKLQEQPANIDTSEIRTAFSEAWDGFMNDMRNNMEGTDKYMDGDRSVIFRHTPK